MDSKFIIMRNNIFTFLLFLSCSISIFGQNLPSLLIDNVSTQFSNVSLPYWMKAGQTINIGTNAKSVSILEFTVNGSSLEFSQAISLTSLQTVPSNKVWKVEAIGLAELNTLIPSFYGLSNSSTTTSSSNLPTIYQSPLKYETPGTYNWKVPPGISVVCIEVWGGGGGGPGVNLAGHHSAGGGGGGYGYGCFTVVEGATYSVVVGGGGGAPSPPVGPATNGGTSSVGTLIYATGGTAGGGPSNSSNCSGMTGGVGGTSNGTYSINGQNGGNSMPCSSLSGNGGNGGNGGIGGAGIYAQGTGTPGLNPGGGGSGSLNSPTGATLRLGGYGGNGKVVIYW
jgi:hypothetical protein